MVPAVVSGRPKEVSSLVSYLLFIHSVDGFHGGMASLSEGKSQDLCLAQLCTKYRIVSTMLSPYH